MGNDQDNCVILSKYTACWVKGFSDAFRRFSTVLMAVRRPSLQVFRILFLVSVRTSVYGPAFVPVTNNLICPITKVVPLIQLALDPHSRLLRVELSAAVSLSFRSIIFTFFTT